MSQPGPQPDNASKGRPPLCVILSDAGASPSPLSASRPMDTPKTRRVARFPTAERKRALDLCCTCVDDAYQAKDGPALQHASYFRASDYKALKKALCLKDDPRTPQDMAETSEDDSVLSGAEQDNLTDTAGPASRTGSPSKQRRMPSLWRRVQHLRHTSHGPPAGTPTPPAGASPVYGGTPPAPRQRSDITQSLHLPTASPQQQPNRASPPPDHSCSTDGARCCSGQAGDTPSSRSITVERALDVVQVAAAVKGEVQPWIWLLRALSDCFNIQNVHAGVHYLAKVAKHIAPEEEWLRLLVVELQPIMEHLQDTDLPPRTIAALERVADKALQVGETALGDYRCNRSSQSQNAAILRRAVQLLTLMASCGSTEGGDMAEMFHVHLESAAQRRFQRLVATLGAAPGVAGGPAAKGIGQDRGLSALLAATEQLVQDVADDADVYQAALPQRCAISLPAISCRVFCQNLRPNLQRVLASGLAPSQTLFDLLEAVHQLELHAMHWCPSVLGSAGVFVDGAGLPLFQTHVDEYLKGVRAKLLEWSNRLIEQEAWGAAGAGTVRCSRALVDMWAALCAVAEENARVAAAHIAYAAALERALTRAAMQHVLSLEKLCQEQLPKPSAQAVAQAAQLLRLKTRATTPARLWRPSRRLCALLNDLREVRNKQAELAAAVRSGLPEEWWGMLAGADGALLGSRLQLCQVEMERRFAAVLHHVVRRLMDSVAPAIRQLLEAQPGQGPAQAGSVPSSDAAIAQRWEPLTGAIAGHLGFLAPVLDPRVLRRAARELWSSAAGCVHDLLLDGGEGAGEALRFDSLSCVGPRLQTADAALKFLGSWFVGEAHVGLTDVDEPEKSKKLRRMLSPFLQVRGSTDMGSIDL